MFNSLRKSMGEKGGVDGPAADGVVMKNAVGDICGFGDSGFIGGARSGGGVGGVRGESVRGLQLLHRPLPEGTLGLRFFLPPLCCGELGGVMGSA